MNLKGIVSVLFVIALIVSAGCTSSSSTNKTRSQITITDTPTLPDEYNAKVPTTVPISQQTTITLNVTPPVILPYALTTINGSGLSGNTTNSTNTSGVIVPMASFTSTTAAGFAPFAIQFTDTSANQPTSWTWDFGDGGTSTLQNPAHTYLHGGLYNVSFSATNSAGTGFVNAINYASAYSPGFTGSPVIGSAPLVVVFTSTGYGSPAPSSWYWDFGDGSSSRLVNVTHQYMNAGTYNVSYLIRSSVGSIWVNKTNYITAV